MMGLNHLPMRTPPLSSLDDSLPSPLTTRNLRPRFEARRASNSGSSFMSTAGPASSRGTKRDHSNERSGSRKRSRTKAEVLGEDPDVEELPDGLATEDVKKESNLPASSSRHIRDMSKRSPNSHSLASLLNPADEAPDLARDGTRTPPAEGSARAPIVINSPAEFTVASSSKLLPSAPSPKLTPPPSHDPTEPEPLSSYTCPICFFPPTNATLTPCGHVCCGSCLFTAVKTMSQRGAMMPGRNVARCPVCRAEIPGWDGRGGGVIGLKARLVFSL